MRFILTLFLLAAPLSFAAVAPRSVDVVPPPAQFDGRGVWVGDSVFDASGNQYLVGQVCDGQTAVCLTDPSGNTGDLLVIKLSPSGQTLYANTFGPPDSDGVLAVEWGVGAAVASDGRLFVAGLTSSADFPNPGDPAAPNQRGGFVVAVSPDGSEILEGARIDGIPTEIAVGPNGEVYVAGDSESTEFPITAGTIPPSGPGAIYVSADGGETWQDSSSGLTDRVFGRPIFHPVQTQVVYLEQTIGLARSADGGLTWTEKRVPTGDQLPFIPPWLRPRGIALDPRDADVVYSGGPDGLFRSDDGASSWTKLPLEVWIVDLVLDPDSPDTLYALGNDGFYKSTDAGQTWTLQQAASGFRGAVALDPSDSQTVYFAEWNPGGQVQRSTDGGATWTSIRSDLPDNLVVDSIAVDPFDSDVLYVGSGHQGVFRSDDAGQTWSQQGAATFDPIAGARIVADPLVADRLWASAQRSDDAGLTWETVGDDLDFPLATLFAPDPSSTGRVLAATADGGRQPNAFLMRFSQTLEVEYARIFGGLDRDHVRGMTIDSTGAALIVGYTFSPDFPMVNALDAEFQGTHDVFLVSVSPDGQTVDLSTFLGTRTTQIANSVAVAPDGSIYVAGQSSGELVNGSSFESMDGYIAKIASDRGSLEAVFAVGGSSSGDSLFEVAVTPSGTPVVLGVTTSSDFRPNAFGGDCTALDSPDGAHFIALLDADLSGVQSMLRYSAPPLFHIREVLGLNVDATTVDVAFKGVSRLALPGMPIEDREGWQRISFDLTEDDSDMAVACALNGASFASGPVSPGQILTLQGVGLGPDELVAFSYEDGQSLPTELGGVRVLFDDQPAAIFHAWDAQTSVVVPSSVSGQTSVEVEMGGAKSAPIVMGVSTASPGLFLIGGEGEALVDANWQFVNASNPVAPGDVVTAYLTGSGPFSTTVDFNAWAPVEAPFATVTGNVTATIGGVAADVVYIGQAPGLPNAVQQVNVVVPAGVSSTEPADFTLSGGGASTQPAPLYLAAP